MALLMCISTGVLLAIGLPPTINDALNFGGLDAGMAVLLLYQLWMPFQGMLTFGGFVGTLPYAVLFIFVTGVLYIVIILVPYAALHPDYSPSAIKAAILSPLFILSITAVHLTRIRWPAWSGNGLMVQLMVTMFSMKAYWYDSVEQSLLMWLGLLVYYSMAVVTILIVLLLLPDSFADRRARQKLSRLVRTMKLIVCMAVEQVSGTKTGQDSWTASQTFGKLASDCIREFDNSKAQIDLFYKPHMLPAFYQDIFHRIVCVKATLMSCFWASDNNSAFKDERVQSIQPHLDLACEQVARGVQWNSDLTLEEASKGCEGLMFAMSQIPPNDEEWVVRDVRRRFLVIITELSYCYHFLFPSIPILVVPVELVRPLHVTMPPFDKVSQVEPRRELSKSGQLLKRLKLRPWQLALTVQLFVPAIFGTLLVVLPSVNQAFQGHASWAILSMVLIADVNCSGNVVESALIRVMGTVLGAATSLLIIALAWSINGLSFENTPGKLIVAGVTSWIFLTVTTFLFWKGGRWAKSWFTAGMAVCIIVLMPLESETGPPWALAGLRVGAVIIGVVIQVVSSLTLFPVTVQQQTLEKALVALELMEEMCLQLSQLTKLVDNLQKVDRHNVATAQSVSAIQGLKMSLALENRPMTRQILTMFGKKAATMQQVDTLVVRLDRIRTFLSTGITVVRSLYSQPNPTSLHSLVCLDAYFQAYGQVLHDVQEGLKEPSVSSNLFSSIDVLRATYQTFDGASEVAVTYGHSGLRHLYESLKAVSLDFSHDEQLATASTMLNFMNEVLLSYSPFSALVLPSAAAPKAAPLQKTL
jgi:hypothetical protein